MLFVFINRQQKSRQKSDSKAKKIENSKAYVFRLKSKNSLNKIQKLKNMKN
jgi:hypothetical protein